MFPKDLCIRSKTAKLNNESSYLFWHVMKGHVASFPETGDSKIHAANWRSYKTHLRQALFVVEALLKTSVPLPPSCNWISMENNKFWAHTLYKYILTSGFLMLFIYHHRNRWTQGSSCLVSFVCFCYTTFLLTTRTKFLSLVVISLSPQPHISWVPSPVRSTRFFTTDIGTVFRS
jgi:hypothetical protein